MLNALTQLTGQVYRKFQQLDWEAEGIARELFTEHRRRLLSAYLAWIRLQHTTAMFNPGFGASKRLGGQSLEWTNAAAMILTYADVNAQELFLAAADVGRNEMVHAVVWDGGIYDENKHWQELWR